MTRLGAQTPGDYTSTAPSDLCTGAGAHNDAVYNPADSFRVVVLRATFGGIPGVLGDSEEVGLSYAGQMTQSLPDPAGRRHYAKVRPVARDRVKPDFRTVWPYCS
jgi:hypothetical protein